ncbi:MAG: TetM/TetW/TetO/TetS family tetracycline resistance ribosomal protection protein [Defluviitaleaceae bacterium]|nr:TetM/TetW/TetO/TetS family tetracycline resistance ribosomal protection protein [Defluviitaleaceae bacterium]
MVLTNIGILAHVDAGKTTTVEQMLHLYGGLRTPGSVDKGNTQTDFLTIEQQRGISVANASVSLETATHKINIIDTPGHMDFTGEVERALSVLDGVVLVVSAAEGIQSQTERFWKALREMDIPTVIFLNKIDRMGCDPSAVLQALQTEFNAKIIPIDTYENAGEASVRTQPAPLSEDSILELCENDDALAARYLETGSVPPETLETALVNQTKNGIAFPLIYGAAALGLGIPRLVEAIETYLPSAPAAPKGELSGIIYKIEHDKSIGKIAHMRLFEGTVQNRDMITIYRPGLEPFQEKVTQIRKLSGAKREDVGLAYGNEIAAVCGMTGAKAGDMVGQLLARRGSSIATPLFTVQVFGPEGKESQLIQAISEMSDEDPLMDYTWNYDERELVIRTMGNIQLEILAYLLQERYGMAVQFSPPSVIYKETVTHKGTGHESYTMPKPCWALVTLDVEPLPRGSGFMYKSATHQSVLQERYQNHVKIAVADAVKQGRLGWEVTDAQFTLTAGGSHIYHTHPMDFFLATPIAVMRALEAAGPTLLEPLVKLRLTAAEELSGKLIGDIVKMRGEFDSPVIAGGKLEMEAIVPVATSMDYAIRFSSLTSGRGIMKSDFYGYVECPLEMGAMSKRRGIDPLDRDKWILYKRGALGS